MTDIRIINHTNLAGVWTDWLLLKNGILDTTEELVNVVKVALLTDSLSDIEEILPDPDSTDRRGWWGDLDAETIWTGWPIGCKCWLLKRAKINPAEASEGSTLVRAETYVRQALQPMIDQMICTAIDVSVTRIGKERIDVLVTVYRGPQADIQLQFQNLWTDMRE